MADESESALDAARAQLYGADLDDFTPLRTQLAATAKKSGDADAARLIAALRKPTRGAWTVNQLARAAAAELAELFDVGDALLAAQTSLDGSQLRALSMRRRQVVDALVEQALRVTGQAGPAGASEAVRAEVRSTLEAAMADADVRADVRAGVLVRAAQFTGFGAAGGPSLSLVPEPTVFAPTASERFEPKRPVPDRPASAQPASKRSAPDRPAAAQPASKRSTRDRPAPAQPAPNSSPPDQPASTRPAPKRSAPDQSPGNQAQRRAAQAERRRAAAQAETERRQRERADARRAQASAAIAAADTALAQAVRAEKDANRDVRLAQEQLADARRRLDDARLDVRHARSQRARAVTALRDT